MLLITAVIARPFNSKKCEVLYLATRLDDSRELEERLEVRNVYAQWNQRFKDQGEEGKLFRQKYEHIIFMHRNRIDKHYRFTDPAVIERQKAIQAYRHARTAADRAEAELQNAREIFQRVDNAEAARDAAEESLEASRAALEAIAPEVLNAREFNDGLSEDSEEETESDLGVFASSANAAGKNVGTSLPTPEPVEIVMPTRALPGSL